MLKMKRLLYLYAFIVLIVLFVKPTKVFANPTMDAKWVLVTNDAKNLVVKLQIKTNTSSEALSNANFIFTYDPTSVSFPTSPSAGTDYSFSNFSGGNYTTATVTVPTTNTISVNINENSSPGTTIPTATYIDVVTITFTTTDPTGSSTLTWAMNESTPPTMDDVFDDAFSNFDEGTFSGSSVSALPITLQSFAANLKNNKVYLEWTTSSEINNAKFNVERSHNGVDFSGIAEVAGAGNSQVIRNYSSVDEAPLPGVSYYRLKQTDFNGTFTYSNIVAVTNTGTDRLVFNSINPSLFSDHVTLDFNMAADARVSFIITNSQGATMLEQNIDGHSGNNTYNVNGLFGLKPGIYYAHLRSDNFDRYQKMVKVN